MFSASRISKFLTSIVPISATCVARSAGRTSLMKNAVRNSSVLTRTSSSGKFKLFNSTTSTPCGKTCTCGLHHKLTEGDQDIVTFLDKEIEYEKDTIQDLPKIKDFKLKIDGGQVTLIRKHNGERIVVSFDINENVNIDEAPTEEDIDDEGAISNIVSYPSFQVQIIKDSGRTLQLSCMFNTSLEEQIEEDDEGDMENVFRFDSVSVLPTPDAMEDGEPIYEAETENMDTDLYKMLVNTMYERGLNNDFANNLLEISTMVEHKEYVDFLQDLKSFFSSSH